MALGRAQTRFLKRPKNYRVEMDKRSASSAGLLFRSFDGYQVAAGAST